MRAEYYYQTRTYYDPSNVDVQSQGDYGLGNIYIGYTTAGNPWQFELFAKNLADRSYFTNTVANGLVPAGQVGPPRTYGLRLTVPF